MGAARAEVQDALHDAAGEEEDLGAGQRVARAPRAPFRSLATSLMGRSPRPTRLTCTLAECGPVLAVKSAVRPPGSPVSEIIVV